MFAIEKFLCFKIETGGLIIGYINCIAAVSLICLVVFNCEWILLFLKNNWKICCKFLDGDDTLKLLMSLVGAIIYGISSYFVITGIKCVRIKMIFR